MANDLVHLDHLTAEKADDLRTRVQDLVRDLASTTWEVAAIVHRLWDAANHFHRWGYSSRNEWLELDLGLAPRKAEQLRRMYEYFTIETTLPFPLDQRLRKLDWTKARSLVGHVNADNAQEFIEKAETATRDELGAWVQQRTNASSNGFAASQECPGEFFRPFRIALADSSNDDASQYKTVRAALQRAKELSGSNKDGHNLTLISTDFLATNSFGQKDDPNMRARYLARIEIALGVRLIAIDVKTGEIIHNRQLAISLFAPTLKKFHCFGNMS